MKRQIKFIHAADLHLDSPFIGLGHLPKHIYESVKESTFQALQNLIDLAIKEKVDFILLVGDLFDNEKQSIKAQMRLREAFLKLKQANIQVYLSYGNHDFLNGNQYPVDFPENVHCYTSEKVTQFTFEKDKQKLATIYGFSYENRAVTKNKTGEYIIDKSSRTPFHIAMLHGNVGGSTEHDNYAPFQLSELKQTNFDYWALGHVHKREILSKNPAIIYPGNIQGRHRYESGTKGCYLIQLNKNDCGIQYRTLAPIEFSNLSIDITSLEKISEITELIHDKLKNSTGNGQYLITLEIIVTAQQWGRLKEEVTEIIDWINEKNAALYDWKFIYKLKITPLIETELAKNHSFIGEMLNQFEELKLEEVSTDLTTHAIGKRYAEELLETIPEQEIFEEAKQLLLAELAYKRR